MLRQQATRIKHELLWFNTRISASAPFSSIASWLKSIKYLVTQDTLKKLKQQLIRRICLSSLVHVKQWSIRNLPAVFSAQIAAPLRQWFTFFCRTLHLWHLRRIRSSLARIYFNTDFTPINVKQLLYRLPVFLWNWTFTCYACVPTLASFETVLLLAAKSSSKLCIQF